MNNLTQFFDLAKRLIYSLKDFGEAITTKSIGQLTNEALQDYGFIGTLVEWLLNRVPSIRDETLLIFMLETGLQLIIVLTLIKWFKQIIT